MDHRRQRSSDEQARGGMAPTRENPDVFDDEFAVDGFDMVADGFRPDSDAEQDARSDRHSQDPPLRSVSAHYATNPALTLAPTLSNRDSTRKSAAYDNPFTSPEDEPRMEFERTGSMSSYAPGIARRSVSSASSQNFAGTGSTRFGAGGPSHPYAMYQQGIMPRSPSVATSTTAQPLSRGSTLRHGPQHPYAMYPQGVSADEIEEDETVDATVPVAVGFPGLGGQSFQRIRGPDGEEQDIIGADGHTEQLPPYSRYPEDGPKMPLLAVPGELHSRGPVAGNDPSMPLMHAQLAPTPSNASRPRQSMMDQSILDRHSTTDRGIDQGASESLMGSVGTADSLVSNKSWKEKSWKEKRKTRFCGIPFWIFVLIACIIGFIAAIVGGVIGGYVSGSSQSASDKNVVTVVSTSLYDASLIASPTIAPPSGTYALTLSEPEETRANCLVDQSQSQAWGCDLGGNPALAISVGVPTGPKPTSGAYLFYGSSDTEICYGSQYQFMATDFSPFLTVQDNDDPENGPAFYFEQTYDKVVVLPETAFDAPTASATGAAKEKRQWNLPEGWGQQKKFVQPGEKPWFCVWNNTFLEGFIYVQEPIASSLTETASTLSPTSISANSSLQTSTLALSTALVSGASPPTPATTNTPSATADPDTVPLTGSVTMTVSNPSTTTTLTEASTPTWDYEHNPGHKYYDADGDGGNDYYDYEDDDDEIEVDADAADGSAAVHPRRRPRQERRRQATRRQTPDDMFSQLPMYPYVIKLEERRLANNPVAPYCQQYQILDTGGYNTVPHPVTGEPYTIELEEQDPSYAAYQTAGTAGSAKEKRFVPNGCHCQWTSGE